MLSKNKILNIIVLIAAVGVGAYFAKYDTEYNKLAEVIVPAGKKGYVDYIIFE